MRIAILGPTASGKSALAVLLAKRIGATVVNGDPFQALKGLAIGTGQPTRAEQGGVPHLGYGVLPLNARPHPAGFGAQVRASMEGLERVVLVTGSGLYLRGIWQQLTELPDVPEAIEIRLRNLDRRMGTPVLHRYLAAVDPNRAAALHPRDSARVLRALALHYATGQRPSELLSGVVRGVPEGWKALVVLPERESLRARVARRVRGQIEAGWPKEARKLAKHREDLEALRPLGYLPWLDGQDDAVIEAEIVSATRQYAKRQSTFFRNQWPEMPIWDPDTMSVEQAFELLEIQP
jgi:tRNA dimethylallyltransferase